MTLLLQTSLFISLFTCGVYYLSLEGFPFFFYRMLIYRILGIKYNKAKDETDFPNNFIEQLNKPLIGCPPCMCSFYGIAIAVVLSWSGFIIPAINPIIFYGICIFIAASINRIITQIIG